MKRLIKIIKDNKLLCLINTVLIIACLLLLQGCLGSSKSVTYQKSSPFSTMVYSWTGTEIKDQPLSLKEWLDIIIDNPKPESKSDPKAELNEI